MHTPDEWNQRLGCDTGESYKLANEQLRSDLRKLTNRIKQLLHNRGWAAAEAVMDKMAEEISQPNAKAMASADEKTPTEETTL